MKFGAWSNLAISASGLGALVIGAAFFGGACSTKTTTPPGPTTGTAPACSATPGTFPAPNCDNSAQACASTAVFKTTDPKCGDPATCQPMASNASGKPQDFRIRRLTLAAPDVLTQPVIQNNIVNKAVTLNAPECGETPGTGRFSWLIRVDRATNTLTTGGAPPPTDPFGTGYCFANHSVNGKNITPVTGTLTFNGDAFSSTPATTTLFVPIFQSDTDPSQVIILPLQGATIKDATISKDGNCIGTSNLNALAADGTEDTSQCSKWNTNGEIGGFITLADADTVNIDLLSESLCVLLTKTAKDANNKCPKDANGNIAGKGDYCSTTNAPGGCQDAYWLTATFAASAVKINDGTSTPFCQAGVTDAGTDTGTTPDAGSDAAGDAAGD